LVLRFVSTPDWCYRCDIPSGLQAADFSAALAIILALLFVAGKTTTTFSTVHLPIKIMEIQGLALGYLNFWPIFEAEGIIIL
jgi:hypothetical protein